MLIIPYGLMDLQISLINVQHKLQLNFDEQKIKEVLDEVEKLTGPFEAKECLDEKTAEYHGMSVEELLNSSDYQMLCKIYMEGTIYQIVEKLMKILSLTAKEAWALVAYGLGLLK